MRVLAACPADEPPSPEVIGRKAIDALEDIRATVHRIEMLAMQHPENPLLAAAALRATEAGVEAGNLAAREILVEEIRQEGYAKGRTDMAIEVSGHRRLRPVS